MADFDANADIRSTSKFDVLGHDLDWTVLNTEYSDLLEHDKLKYWHIILSRVVRAKPHSGGVERLIGKGNVIKNIFLFILTRHTLKIGILDRVLGYG